jgi:hypothetical protein
LRITVWQVISTLFLLALIGAVAALAFLNAGRTLPSVRASVPTATAGPTIVPTPAVTPRVTATTPAPTSAPVAAPTSAPEPPPTPEPTPTPEPQLARIANTSGQGVSVRLEPGPQAARAGVLREGTRVMLTGNDQTVAARPWREIETEDRRLRGWVLGDFLQLLQGAP